MAQREIKVNVKGNIDRSLTKMLAELDKLTGKTQQISVSVKSSGLDSLVKAVNSISKEKHQVSFKADTGQLDNANKTLKDIAHNADIKFKADSSQIDTAGKAVWKLNNDIKDVNNSQVAPKGSASGLAPIENGFADIESSINEINNSKVSPQGSISAGIIELSSTLDQISAKILDISSQTISPVVSDTLKDATNLFDTQQSFNIQMKNLDKSKEEIRKYTEDISKYASRTKYDTADMLESYAQFEGGGKTDPMKLITGVAGISSMAKDASKAMKSVNTQLKQMGPTSKVYTKDWRAVSDAIGASASKQINEWFKVNKGIELTTDNFAEGLVSAQDFEQAIREVGNSKGLQKVAGQSNSISSAMANMKESLTNALLGNEYDQGPLYGYMEKLVGIINSIDDNIPAISANIEKLLGNMSRSFGQAFKNFDVGTFFKQFFKEVSGGIGPFKLLMDIIARTTDNGRNLGAVLGKAIKWAIFIRSVNKAASALGALNRIAGSFGIGFKGFGNIGGGQGGGDIKGDIGSAIKSLSGMAGAGLLIRTITKSMLELEEAEISGKDIAKRLTQMAGILTAVGGAAVGVGKAMSSFPQLSILGGAGLTALTALSGSLYLITKGLTGAAKAVNSVKLDKNTGKKLKQIGDVMLSMSGMGALNGVIGSLTVFTNALGAFSNMMVGSSIRTAIKVIKDLQSMPKFNGSDIRNKINSLQGVLRAMHDGSDGFVGLDPLALFNSIGRIFQGIDTAIISSTLSNIMNLVKAVSSDEFAELDLTKAQASINKLKNIGTILRGDGVSFDLGILGAIQAGMEHLEVSSVISSFNKIIKFVKALDNKEIQKIDTEKLKTSVNKLNNIKNVFVQLNDTNIFGQIAGAFSSFISAMQAVGEGLEVNGVVTMFTTILNFTKRLAEINKIDMKTIEGSINKLKKITNLLTKFEIKAEINKGTKEKMQAVYEMATTLESFTQKLAPLMAADLTGIEEKIPQIQNAVNRIASITIPETAKDAAKQAASLQKFVTALSAIVTSLSEIGSAGGLENIPTVTEQLKTAIDKVTEISSKVSGLELGDDLNKKAGTLKSFVAALNEIAGSLVALPLVEDVQPKVDGMKTAITSLGSAGVTNAMKTVAKLQESATKSYQGVDAMVKVVTRLNEMPMIAESFATNVQNIQNALNSLAGIDPDNSFAAKVEGMVTAVNNVITKLKSLAASFAPLGNDYAGQIAQGFESSGHWVRFETRAQQLAVVLGARAGEFGKIGQSWSHHLAAGFDIGPTMNKIQQIIDKINSIPETKQVQVNVAYNDPGSPVKKATGGLIKPEYRAKGGRVGGRFWKPQGTDTVPAMLTPGEYVIKRSVTDSLGSRFLDALNKANFTAALKTLSNKVSNVTNVTNNIVQNVDNKASYMNGLNNISRTVRL